MDADHDCNVWEAARVDTAALEAGANQLRTHGLAERAHEIVLSPSPFNLILGINHLLAGESEVSVKPTTMALSLGFAVASQPSDSSEGAGLWLPLSRIPLKRHDDEFNEHLRGLLHRQKVAPPEGNDLWFSYLSNIVFETLQNARLWGGPEKGRSGFAGLHVSRNATCDLSTPSSRSWLEGLADTGLGLDDFVEIIVHDTGIGIVPQFERRAFPSAREGRPDVSILNPAREWALLNTAFENHMHSRRVQTLFDRREYSVGIGLATVLVSLYVLRGYLEIRTGRFRAHRWYRANERVAHEPCLLPIAKGRGAESDPPRPGRLMTGTVVHIVIPIGSTRPLARPSPRLPTTPPPIRDPQIGESR